MVLLVPSAIFVVFGPAGIFTIVAALVCLQGFRLQIFVVHVFVFFILVIKVLVLGLFASGHISRVARGLVRPAVPGLLRELPGPLVVGPSTVIIPVPPAPLVRSLLIHVDLIAAEAEDPLYVMGLVLAPGREEHIHAFSLGESCPTQKSMGKGLATQDRNWVFL